MALRPQDVLIALKLALVPRSLWTYENLAKDLAMSPSEVHGGVRRLTESRLLTPDRQVVRESLLEFLVHGLRFSFPPKMGVKTRGVPTAHAAAPLASLIEPSGDDPPVWPSADGAVRGQSFAPLYRSVPVAAGRDPALYEVLALVDAIRGGRARERELAAKLLRERLR
jgi:hypothetical protein